jgi:hypothetical protein
MKSDAGQKNTCLSGLSCKPRSNERTHKRTSPTRGFGGGREADVADTSGLLVILEELQKSLLDSSFLGEASTATFSFQ